MAKPPPPPQEPVFSSARELRAVIRKFQRRIADLDKFDPLKVSSRKDPDIDVLEAAIAETLRDAFGHQTPKHRDYVLAATLDTAGHNMNGTPHHEVIEGLVHGRERSLALLKQAVRSFEERIEDEFPEANGGGDYRTSAAGNAMAGAAITGFRGVEARGETGNSGSFGSGFRFAESLVATERAYDVLMARVAVLEAALAAPKPLLELPIGPGHNGPPEFDPPFTEYEIRTLVDLLKVQTPTAATELPKLLEATTAAKECSGKLQKHVDDFTDAMVKGAGGEFGKKLAQIPWWLAVYGALNAVLQAASQWMSTLPH